jgi:hypothetical protein
MATFDRDRQEIVLRIVYDGAATAGKTANLRSLHASFAHRAQGELYTPAETPAGRTLYFDSLELLTGYVEEWPIRCQLLTVPGQLAFAERRYRLLRGLDAAVVVCESTRLGIQAAQSSWRFLKNALDSGGNGQVPLIVQANKQDLPGALSPDEVDARLGVGQRLRVLPASALHGEGVRATFLAALDAARDAVRERLRHAGPEALGPPMECAAELYEAMIAEADTEPDPAVGAAVDEALATVEERDVPLSPTIPR